MSDGIKTIILENGHKFYIAFDSDRKPCGHCRKIIHWGYQENGRTAAIEEHEGKFRIHFNYCAPLLRKRYPKKEYIPLTDGVETAYARVNGTGVREERRRYVR